MSPGSRLGIGSLGVVLLLFAVFLGVWRRAENTDGGRRAHPGIALIALAGAALVSWALFAPHTPAPAVPPFLVK